MSLYADPRGSNADRLSYFQFFIHRNVLPSGRKIFFEISEAV